LEQASVRLERRTLIAVERVVADLLEPSLHGFRSDLLLVAFALDHLYQQTLFTVVLFTHLVELLLEHGELVVERVDGIALGSEVPVNENGRRKEIRLEATLALLVLVWLGPG